MIQTNMKNKEVNAVLAKLTLSTDIVTEVATTTDKHYSLNERFEVLRNGKVYFISIKKVDVIGQVIKSHVRLDVDTNLPTPTKPMTKKQIKIMELEERLRIAKANNCKHEIYQCRVDLSKLY
jgi:hypothetical protein